MKLFPDNFHFNDSLIGIYGTHLTTSVAKLPAAVDVRGSRHWIADAGHSNVSESQVDDEEVGGRAQLFELDKHQQHHNVAA